MVSFQSPAAMRAISWIGAGMAVIIAATPVFANSQDSSALRASGPWTSGDYVEAIFAVHNGAITLPRRGNPKTEAYFDRLIDRGNIESLMAGPRAAEVKSRDILIILSATGEFRGRYGYAVSLGDDVQNELVEIQIFRLYLIDRLATLDLADPAAAQRCTSAIATTLSGTLDTLAEAPVFTYEQRVALSSALARHYPAIQARLRPEERQAIRTRLEAMALAESDLAMKAAFAAALADAGSGN